MGALEDGIQVGVVEDFIQAVTADLGAKGIIQGVGLGVVPPAITQGAEMDSEIQDSAVDKPLHLLQHQPLRQTMEEVHC